MSDDFVVSCCNQNLLVESAVFCKISKVIAVAWRRETDGRYRQNMAVTKAVSLHTGPVDALSSSSSFICYRLCGFRLVLLEYFENISKLFPSILYLTADHSYVALELSTSLPYSKLHQHRQLSSKYSRSTR